MTLNTTQQLLHKEYIAIEFSPFQSSTANKYIPAVMIFDKKAPLSSLVLPQCKSHRDNTHLINTTRKEIENDHRKQTNKLN